MSANVFSHLSGKVPFRRLSTVVNHLLRVPTMSGSRPTAGIIIIGDEILKGHTQDTNSFFLSKQLYSLGIRVERISVIGDELSTIAKEIAEFSSRFTHVITAGGIGPTHDDITFAGAAKAFEERLEPHPILVELCRKYFGQDAALDSPKLKMAHIPASSELHFGINKKTGEQSKYPIISVRNVIMFPGIPTLVERGFSIVKDKVLQNSDMFYIREIYTKSDEVSIAPILNQFNAKYQDTIQLGSYPDWLNNYYRVKLTLECDCKETLDVAHEELLNMLPSELVVKYEKDSVVKAEEQVYSIVESDRLDEYVEYLRRSVRTMEEALDKYKLDEICIGFNGGKDCTALLHLFYAVVKRKYPKYDDHLQALYIKNHSTFPEAETFFNDCTKRYNLKSYTIQSSMKVALLQLKEQAPHVKAILMGTRKSDPYSAKLDSFTMTDPDWPQFMRINPLLHWRYQDVWMFLRQLFIPYCILYDQGYTSMGAMDNTKPNALLKYIDENGKTCYRPAYELEDESQERNGRNGTTDKKWNKEVNRDK
ncbi:FAD synthase-like [Saccoglossus kowalevskii]|uniref:FAD synthase n=1 Tax=Saccoglossus kowalevskii TaxID=10224 RepID=A0ABM0MGM4_SACKO|nr:PREDICTED: FAD synthase-like [Saccoglossus kowalevskii]